MQGKRMNKCGRMQFLHNARLLAIAMAAAACVVKLCVDALPDAAVAFGFMRPAARLAAAYLGAAFDESTMELSARGVTIVVVRACSATDFFSMTLALLALALPIRCLALRIPAAIASAWLVAVVANAARLVVCVSVDAFVPEAQIPVVHMVLGVAVFLPVFAALWYTLVTRKELTHGKHATD